jgi:hypothetical protein
MQNISYQYAFYKRLKELILSYSELFNEASRFGDALEDTASYYAGIIAGLREVECYLSNNEPWSREVLILEMVVEKAAILGRRNKNQNVKGFNLIYSEGEEKAMDIIQNEICLFFPLLTRNIVVCKE